VGRRNAIGYAIARRLQVDRVMLQFWDDDTEDLAAALRAERPDVEFGRIHADFTRPESPEQVVESAVGAFGHLDILVVNHAHSSSVGLGELTAEEIDRALAVNVRASLLLVQAYYARHDGREGGRVVLMTSGQHRGAMPGELPYIAGKGALAQLTLSLSAAVADKRITVNCVDPGATDTGWADAETHAAVLAEEPWGRWGRPDDAARLIAFLCSPEGEWITGQVITSSGGGP
jgi:3-oxoacyl-[acyl-carrier protein] reductase